MPPEADASVSHAPPQPAWVLLTASNNLPNMARDPEDDHPILGDHALLSSRGLNTSNPAALVQPLPEHPGSSTSPSRCALVLTGELRCIARSQALFERLSRQADLYIVTSAPYRQKALALVPAGHCLIVDDWSNEAAIDAALPMNAMKQWHKLSLALRMIRHQEQSRHKRYRYIVKLRSDYYFAHPERMLQQIANACRSPEAGLVGASDKVFGGPRELMMQFEGFFRAIPHWFDQREHSYWPINLQQVLASDDAVKWYGMNWPQELVGTPQHPRAWRQALLADEQHLTQALANHNPDTNAPYHRLLKGDPSFASEICFSRFLNFCGIPFHDCPALRGFLYSDRSMQP